MPPNTSCATARSAWLPALAAATLVLFAPAATWANDASMSFEGGTPHIKEEADVALVREHLRFIHRPPILLAVPTGLTCETYFEALERSGGASAVSADEVTLREPVGRGLLAGRSSEPGWEGGDGPRAARAGSALR